MNPTTRWALALVLLPVAACSSTQPMVASAPPGPPPIAAADQTFVNAAAGSDAFEIQSSQLAEKKARSPRIKRFAAKMITDHTATTQQLTTIAQSKSITITPTASDPAIESKLEADNVRSFDRDYMHDQIDGHTAAVQAFQDEIANGQDPDLKAFAQKTLPTIQQHLKMADQLAGVRMPKAAAKS